jgi:hypothetical protein
MLPGLDRRRLQDAPDGRTTHRADGWLRLDSTHQIRKGVARQRLLALAWQLTGNCFDSGLLQRGKKPAYARVLSDLGASRLPWPNACATFAPIGDVGRELRPVKRYQAKAAGAAARPIARVAPEHVELDVDGRCVGLAPIVQL